MSARKQELIEEIIQYCESLINDLKTGIVECRIPESKFDEFKFHYENYVKVENLTEFYKCYEELIMDEVGFYVRHRVVKEKIDQIIMYDRILEECQRWLIKHS